MKISKLKNSSRILSVCVIIFVFTFGAYLIDLKGNYTRSLSRHNHRRLISSQDAFPTSVLPYVLIKYKTFSLNEAMGAFESTQDRIKTPYYVAKVGDNYYSKYPVFTAIMAVPIYFLPTVLNKIPGLSGYDYFLKLLVLGRISAAFYSSLSVVIFFLIIREISKYYKKIKNINIWQYLFTFFYAFGTTTYSISTRALWQHTGAQFFISLAVLFLVYGLSENKYIKGAGLSLSLAVLCRPTVAILYLVIFLYVFLLYKSKIKYFIMFSIPAGIFLSLYNYLIFGNIISTGYAAVDDVKFTGNIIEGVIGLLFTPTHGILFTSAPLILFLPTLYSGIKNLIHRYKHYGNNQILKWEHLKSTLAVGLILHFLLVTTWWCWWGIDSASYRMLTEYLPIIGLFSYEVSLKLEKIGKMILVLLMLFSVYVHLNSIVSHISRCETTNFWSFECLSPERELLELGGFFKK